MAEHGGEAEQTPRQNIPRSRLYDYAEMTLPSPEGAASANAHPGRTEPDTEAAPDPTPALDEQPEPAEPAEATEPAARTEAAPETEARERAFAALLGEFRRTPVLVPLGDGSGPDSERGLLTADFNGVRFILAFSDEQALARYAVVRGEAAREWTYQTILGARLLDVAVPAAGVPCGVALDCADGEDGMVFPPVRGIVPDEVAVDVGAAAEDEGGER
ncbi:hypothetical protein AB0L10_18925 [Streptomyces flaveolus]|uniref:hypothetical protein n=1 Tax=Streptomyces flaveolus TaxID=67297 RepID=UPI0034138938